MSITSLSNELIRHQKSLADLQKKLSEESKKEYSKTKEINTIERSITNSTTSNTLRSKQQQIIRKMDEISKSQTKKAEIAKKISTTNEKLQKVQIALSKEQERDRKKIQDAEKNRENMQLNHERAITRELKTQYSIRNQPVSQPEIQISNSTGEKEIKYDVFISHASEDKDNFVKPLVDQLNVKGYKVWYDEFSLKVGDSLRRSIDSGLLNSRYGIVVLSNAFFAKNWTQYELDGLVTREMEGHKVILPIWHLVTKDQVQQYSPSLADKVAINSSLSTISEIVLQLSEVLDE